MKLNHVNLTVTDVSETRKFLEKYFGLQGSINPYSGESIEGSGIAAVLPCCLTTPGWCSP
jgi:catechol-2,3-dioxygenase